MDREQRQKPKERRKGKLERSIAQGTSETERKSGNGKRCPLGVNWFALPRRAGGTGARGKRIAREQEREQRCLREQEREQHHFRYIGGGVGFVDSASEENKARAVAEIHINRG